MAAKAPAKAFSPSETVDRVLLRVLARSPTMCNLSKQQSSALKFFISGSDTFVSLPTGHRKSLIYQLAIPFAKELLVECRDDLPRSFPSNLMLLVIAPLTALISDQMESCKKFGLRCCKLEEVTDCGDTNIDIVFTSPENLEKLYEVVSGLSDRIFGVVVDETHCFVTW